VARPARTREEVEKEVAPLGDLDLYVLRDRWRELYGRPPPKSLRRDFLARACAHQIRVNAFGGLSPATKRRLQAIAEAARTGNVDTAMGALRIKPGTRLLRLWQDKTHTVTALAEGFEWKGSRYGSLSAVAKAITGTNWNGYAFFGLKRPPARNKNGAGPRRRRANPAVEPGDPIAVADAPAALGGDHG
jgi:hypothetical protein